MIFFLFSLFASLLGGLSSSRLFVTFNVNLSVQHPFSGIISFWPFIVVLLILLLAILWYQTFKNMRNNKHRKYLKSRTRWIAYPTIITVAILIIIVTPYFLGNNTDKISQTADPQSQVEMIMTVHGMDCTGCEQLINRRVGELEGIDSVSASHTLHQVYLQYNKTKVSLDQISQTIEEAGYTVVYE